MSFETGSADETTGRDVALAHGDSASQQAIEATLQGLSHHVLFTTDSPQALIDYCQQHCPAVGIIGTGFANENPFEVFNRVNRAIDCPLIALIQADQVELASELINDSVMGILIEPVSESDIRPAIYLACRRYEQARQLEQRAEELEDRIESTQSEPGDG